jgi:F420-0:gamma-glutamyl ligase
MRTKGKKERLEKRANLKMAKAQKNYREAEGALADAKKSNNPAEYGAAEQLYRRSSRQEAKAKLLKSKSAMMKTGGMVNPNAKVSKQVVPGSKGVKVGVNPKASASKIASSKGSGKANTPPTKVIPAAKYGRMMKKGGSVKSKK